MMNAQELRRLAKAATPGPWVCEDKGFKYVVSKPGDGYISREVCKMDSSTMASFRNKENGPFIAAANPDAITELLDRLEAADQRAKVLHEDFWSVEDERRAICLLLAHPQNSSVSVKKKVSELIAERDDLRKRLDVAKDKLEKTRAEVIYWKEMKEPGAAGWRSLARKLSAELTDLRSSMAYRTSLIGRIEAERDELRAKVEVMENQEPTRDWWDALIADVSSIDCMYRGSPTYAHDAYWMRDRVEWILKQRRDHNPDAKEGEEK